MTVSVAAAPTVPAKFFDNNVVPLSGGKLFTYAAGTTTKQTTYADAAGTQPNTNPIILNSRGETPIYLDTSLAYKFVLAPATDTDPPQNPIWTEDNITPPDSKLRSDLSQTTGAGLVGNKSPLTGSVSRTVAQVLSDWVNVKDFGAKLDASSDGSTGTDDTAAFAAAFTALGATPGTLIIPAGNAKITGYLSIPSNCKIKGASRKGSKLIATQLGGGGANAGQNVRNGSLFYSGQPINGPTRVDLTIEDLWLHGPGAGSLGAAFYQQSGSVVTVRNCEIENFKWGVILDQSECAIIDGCELGSAVSGGAGIWIVNGADLTPGASGGYSNVIAVRDCSLNVANGAYGAVDDGGMAHTFDGCNLNGGVNGIRVAGASGIQISGCYAESQSAEIIHFDSKSLAGNGAGGNVATIIGGEFIPGVGNPAIKGYNSAGALVVIGGSWGTSTPNPLVGASEFHTLAIIVPGYPNYPETADFCDGTAADRHFESGKLAMTEAGILTVPSIVTSAVTVANLPASPVAGEKAFVTDATSATFLAAVTGGGTNKVPVFHDGTGWKVG